MFAPFLGFRPWSSTTFSLLVLLLLLLLLRPLPLGAQAVKGVVLVAGSGSPIEGVAVGFLDSDDRVVAGVLTDEQGRFVLKAPWVGRFRIQCDRIGYTSATSAEVDLLPADTLEVEMRLDVEAVEMAPLTIVSDRQPLVLDARLARWGYYERREQFRDRGTGVAHFIDIEDIERRHPGRATDMLQMLAGVNLMPSGRRGIRILNSRKSFRHCAMTVYLDGVKLDPFPDESINDYVSPISLTAIEVYVQAPYPIQYAPNPGGCGCVLFWTGFAEGARGGR